MIAGTEAKSVTVEAVITRKDGTVEDLGVVSYYHKNPVKRLLWRARQEVTHGIWNRNGSDEQR